MAVVSHFVVDVCLTTVCLIAHVQFKAGRVELHHHVHYWLKVCLELKISVYQNITWYLLFNGNVISYCYYSVRVRHKRWVELLSCYSPWVIINMTAFAVLAPFRKRAVSKIKWFMINSWKIRNIYYWNWTHSIKYRRCDLNCLRLYVYIDPWLLPNKYYSLV